MASSNPLLNAEVIIKADEMGVAPAHINAEWEDVSAQFDEVAKTLEVGQIIASSSFSLQEAMSAIELMDPKMDIGLGSAHVATLAQIEASGRLPKIETLSRANWLSIMDKLIVGELMHYQGPHLALNLLTCYYIHDVKRLLKNSEILLNFTQILLRRCHYLRECFGLANNYSEEDYIQYSFGYDIGDSTTPQDEIDLLQQCDALVAQETEKLATLTNEEEKNVTSAIIVRLRWNKAMLLAQMRLSAPLNEKLAESATYLQESITYTKEIVESAKYAQDPEAKSSSSSSDKPAAHPDASIKIFEYEIMRKLANTTPPRFVPWDSMETAMENWSKILTNLIELTGISSVISTLRDAKDYLTELSADRKADMIVKARFLTIVWNQKKFFGKTPLEEILLQDCTTHFGIPLKYAKSDEKTLTFHLGLCETGISDLFRALGLNRSRARRRLPHIFEHWETLLYDGDVLDSKLTTLLKLNTEEERGRGFARWHLDHVQQMIAEFLTIGFELNLYENYEVPMIWWYLDNIAAARQKSQMKVLEAAEVAKRRALSAGHQQQHNNKKKGQQQQQQPIHLQPGDVKPNWFAVELEAKFNLTRGLFLFIAALDAAGYFPISAQNLGSARTRFFSRFHNLLSLNQPTGLRFQQFQTTYLDVLAQRSASDLLARANKSIQAALKNFQDLINFSQPDGTSTPITTPSSVVKEAKKLQRLTLMNGFQIASLTKTNTLDHKANDPAHPALVVSLDFASHRQYPIVSLKPKPEKTQAK